MKAIKTLKENLSEKPIISIVIPAFNEERFLPVTLRSLLRQSIDIPCEIVVVDNNSTDKTVQIAKEFDVRIVSEKTKGITFARQAGLNAAIGEIIVTTDSDTVFNKNWLRNLTQPFFDNPNINITYGPSYYKSNGSLRVLVFMWGTNIFRFMIQLLPFIIAGHNMAFRKDKALEIGGYDTTLTHSEDFDISKRIWKGKLFSSRYVLGAGVITSSRRVRNENLFMRMWLTLTDTFGYYSKKEISKEYDDYR